MPKYKKERRHPRFATQNLPGRITFSVDAQVLNISLSGIGVRTSIALHVGRRYGFRLGQEPNAILVSGNVVWCRLAQTHRRSGSDVEPVYHAGFAFSDVISEKTMRLFELIEQSKPTDLRRRIFGRFKVAKDQSIALESKSEFLVKQISLSGMLIESPLALQAGSVFEMEILLAGHTFSAHGRIVHSSHVGLSGVEFLEPSPDQQHVGSSGVEFLEPSPDQQHVGLSGVEFLEPSPDQQRILEDFIREELEQKGE